MMVPSALDYRDAAEDEPHPWHSAELHLSAEYLKHWPDVASISVDEVPPGVELRVRNP